jgi:hypothetical protein
MSYVTTFSIGDRLIGHDQPTYFIADIAANHDGSLDRAINLVTLAKDAGADCAKFQHFRAPHIVSDYGFKALGGQQSHQASWKKSVFEVYTDASLPWEWTKPLAEHAKKIDIEFMWECCGADEFAFETLGREYFGHVPSALESAGLLLRLHGAPMYFYKKGKGRYKAAPADALRAALASVEKKRLLAEQKQAYIDDLAGGRLPPAFQPLLSQLLYAPDKNSLEWKALEAVCEQQKLVPATQVLPSLERK